MKKNKKVMTDADYSGLTLLKKNHKDYPDSPENAKLETFRNAYPNRDYIITFDCPEYTSLCPVTGQPDFGHIIIRYIPDKRCVESKSLKLYLFSFRSTNTFHEESVNRILKDFVEACSPRKAEVVGLFRPRGGIAINVKATFGGKIDE
jgi:7-cyano-7-deazaguanine reductase